MWICMVAESDYHHEINLFPVTVLKTEKLLRAFKCRGYCLVSSCCAHMFQTATSRSQSPEHSQHTNSFPQMRSH